MESFFLKTARYLAEDGHQRNPEELIQKGDKYKWRWIHPYETSGTILEMVENRLLQFTFGNMKVTLDFSDTGQGVLLELKQTQIPDRSETEKAYNHLNCRSCWVHYLTNLKAVLEHGIDLREADPKRSDCVGIDFVPADKIE
jgi:hypothetical protein